MVMVRAVWNGVVVAESDDTIMVEGNHYFPISSLAMEYFTPSATHTRCPWKGVASYYDLNVGDETYPDAAWTYENPLITARKVRDRVAFYGGVRIEYDDTVDA